MRFFTASHLVNLYVEAREQRQIMRLDGSLRKKDLIIVDELGYLPLDTRGAEHLFGFFNQCYEQVSVVVTTNLPFAEWPGILPVMRGWAGAVIDRLTHRVHIVEIIGESYRLWQSLKAKEGGDGRAAGQTPA